MYEILEKQSKQLSRIISLLETNNKTQVHIDHELEQSVDDEDRMVSSLADIASSMTNLSNSNKSISGVKPSQDIMVEANRAQAEATTKHIKALKGIHDLLERNEKYNKIAFKAKDTPIRTSFSDDFRNIGEFFKNIKKSITSITPKGIGQGIASSISSRYKDRLDYIKNEKNLGNTKSEKELKVDYNTRSQLLQRNVKNEAALVKERGSLTEEEFLKGNSTFAKSYSREKRVIGKGLKETDSRYSLDERPNLEDRLTARQNNKFKRDAEQILNVANEKARNIPAMSRINLDTSIPNAQRSVEQLRSQPQEIPTETPRITKEDTSESNRATSVYQQTQLRNFEEQKTILSDQLDTQKEILGVIKEISNKPLQNSAPTSNGGGIGDTLLSGAKSIAKSGGNALKKIGSVASRFMGAAAIPLAVGAVGAAVANVAANEYSDSFGEGGFDLVKKLHEEGTIDYNATVAGFNPSEILDWEAIQKLDPKDIKTLMNSGVEFGREDTSKLHQLYTDKMITGSSDNKGTVKPEAVKPEAVKPTKVVTKEGVSVNQEGWGNSTKPEAVKPEAVKQSQAEIVYNKSRENTNTNTAPQNSPNNVVNAPTINNNSSITQNVIPLPVRNPDNTVQKYVASRYSNQ